MASYKGHLTFSTMLGTAYGTAAWYFLGFDWGPAILGGGMTAIAGLLPDLDSDSGVPVRELFGVASTFVPLMLLHRVVQMGFSLDQILVILGGIYFFIRYVVANLFRRMTVHRGIYHSIPAMLIAGLSVFLLYHSPDMVIRIYLSVGVMIGFLSHLVLDELCSVDINGVAIQLNQFAGTALKFFSPSWPVTLAAYTMLAGLSYLAVQEFETPGASGPKLQEVLMNIKSIPNRWIK